MKKPIKTTFKTIVFVAHKTIKICDEEFDDCVELRYEYDEENDLKIACLDGMLGLLPSFFKSFQDVKKAEEIFKQKNRLCAQIFALLKEEFTDTDSIKEDTTKLKSSIRTYNASLSYKKTKKDVPIEEILKIIAKIIIKTPGIINKKALMRKIKNIIICDNYKKQKENFKIETENWREINRSFVYEINTSRELPFTIRIENCTPKIEK